MIKLIRNFFHLFEIIKIKRSLEIRNFLFKDLFKIVRINYDFIKKFIIQVKFIEIKKCCNYSITFILT